MREVMDGEVPLWDLHPGFLEQLSIQRRRENMALVIPVVGKHAGPEIEKVLQVQVQLEGGEHLGDYLFDAFLYRRGVGLKEIAALLGHSSLETTDIYTHLGSEQLSRAVELL